MASFHFISIDEAAPHLNRPGHDIFGKRQRLWIVADRHVHDTTRLLAKLLRWIFEVIDQCIFDVCINRYEEAASATLDYRFTANDVIPIASLRFCERSQSILSYAIRCPHEKGSHYYCATFRNSSVVLTTIAPAS